MKKKLVQGITLVIIWMLVLLGLPSLAAPEVIEEQTQGMKSKVSSRINSRASSKVESGIRRGLKLLPWGKNIGDFFFGSEAEKSLEVQKEILSTNQDTLSQIRTMASDALKVKRKIEEVDRLRRDAIQLGKDFSKTSFSMMALALGEEVLEIGLNPSDYIPNTEYTRKLKRNLRVDYSRERRFFRGTQQFLKSTRRAFASKEKTYKNTKAFQKKLVRATAYDHHVESYVASRNIALAREYEALADTLLKSNKELEAIMKNEKAHMSAAKAIQIQHIINKNISKALAHKAKANSLLREASRISKTDKEKLAAEQGHLLTQDMIKKELKALQNKEQPSWTSSKQKGVKKNTNSKKSKPIPSRIWGR